MILFERYARRRDRQRGSHSSFHTSTRTPCWDLSIGMIAITWKGLSRERESISVPEQHGYLFPEEHQSALEFGESPGEISHYEREQSGNERIMINYERRIHARTCLRLCRHSQVTLYATDRNRSTLSRLRRTRSKSIELLGGNDLHSIDASARRRSPTMKTAAKRNAPAPKAATKGVTINALRKATHWARLSSASFRKKSLSVPMM